MKNLVNDVQLVCCECLRSEVIPFGDYLAMSGPPTCPQCRGKKIDILHLITTTKEKEKGEELK